MLGNAVYVIIYAIGSHSRLSQFRVSPWSLGHMPLDRTCSQETMLGEALHHHIKSAFGPRTITSAESRRREPPMVAYQKLSVVLTWAAHILCTHGG